MLNIRNTSKQEFDCVGFTFEPTGNIRLFNWTMTQDSNGNLNYTNVAAINQLITNDIYINPETLEIVNSDIEGSVKAFDYVYNSFPELKTMVETFVQVNNLI